MIARVNININGKTINHFDHLSVSQPFDDHHRIEIRIGMDDVNDVFGIDGATGSVNLGRLTQDWSGKKITVTISQGETDILGMLSAVSEQVFEGLVTKIMVQMRDSIDSVVDITAMSPTIILDQGENTYSFAEMSLSDLINKILKADGWQTANSPTNNLTIPYVTQYRETVYHFVQRLAKKYGEWFLYDGSKFVFGKSALTAGEAIPLEYGSNLTDMTYETRLVPLTTQSVSYNYTSDESYTYQSSGGEVSAQNFAQKALQSSLDTYKFQNIDLSFQNYAANAPLEADVTNSLRMASNRLAVLKGTCTTLGLAPGKVISVNDDIQINGRTIRTESYGDFLVTKSYHYLDSNGQYQNTFEAIPNNPDFPPTNYPLVSQPIAEVQKAIVVDTTDPEQLGRVRVHIFWQHPADHTTAWIRVANLMSGDNTGVYFVPEIGETVFVDFESGNPDLPFVRGSMFNGNNTPGGKFSGSGNVYKGIITKGGNHILIDDSNGKENIHIYNKDNKNEILLTLDGGTKIQVRSEQKIVLDAPLIEMNASNIIMNTREDIKMEAMGNIKSKATQNIEAEATADWKVSSNQTEMESKIQTKIDGGLGLELESKLKTEVSSGLALLLEGKGVKIEAGMDMEIEANKLDVSSKASMEIKSAKIDIKAQATLDMDGGMTSLSGKLVKIN